MAAAEEVYEMNRNVRALGMGNAYTALVDDEDSLFFNPAGIGRNSGIFWSVVDFNFGVNDISDTLDTFSDLTGSSSEFASALSNLYGIPYGVVDTERQLSYFHFCSSLLHGS